MVRSTTIGTGGVADAFDDGGDRRAVGPGSEGRTLNV